MRILKQLFNLPSEIGFKCNFSIIDQLGLDFGVLANLVQTCYSHIKLGVYIVIYSSRVLVFFLSSFTFYRH